MIGSGESILEVSDLVVEFDGFRALDRLSFVLYENRLTVVIGPNGAGKTTFLDVITGRTRARSGSVRFLGRDITELPDYRIARLGMVRKFQTPSVFPELSVWENLRVAAAPVKGLWHAVAGRLADDTRQVIEAALETIGLKAHARSVATSLSHGQRQWLEIGMALAMQPKLLLLDEPVAGMTLDEVARTAELLQEIARSRSVLVIEHDMSFVRRIAERVCVFHQGRQLVEGSFERVSEDRQVREVYLGVETA
ncbi:MAG: urea ABC transporter ATP-binding protein UrtD [Chromatiales bacterium 21-64-14]|nr:MAG: urea ABC transporter ATP-binding protein UrtD [Chromatiales bacterium 21-64-14]HQU16905.1 urea ABC transporter ATP-binding protein UrtD [Gammaproteobacteria bacterium]